MPSSARDRALLPCRHWLPGTVAVGSLGWLPRTGPAAGLGHRPQGRSPQAAASIAKLHPGSASPSRPASGAQERIAGGGDVPSKQLAQSACMASHWLLGLGSRCTCETPPMRWCDRRGRWLTPRSGKSRRGDDARRAHPVGHRHKRAQAVVCSAAPVAHSLAKLATANHDGQQGADAQEALN